MKQSFLSLLLFASALFAQTRIASVGNSITQGYGLSDASTQSYPSILQNLLGAGYQVSNFGVSGTTLLQHGDNPYWNQGAFQNARAFLPHIVVIELGTNDSKPYNWYVRPSEFSENLASMIDTFQTLSTAPEVWICLAPYSNNVSWGILDTSLTLRINPALLQVGLDKGVHLLDLHSSFTDRTMVQSDSVHPNAAGAGAIASIIRDHLLRDTLSIQQSGATLIAPPGFAYQWYKDGAPIAQASNPTFDLTELGRYKVSVKVDIETDSRIVSQELTIAKMETPSSAHFSSMSMSSNSSTRILPHPHQTQQPLAVVGQNLHFFLEHDDLVQIRIFDVQGHLYKTHTIPGHTGLNAFPLSLKRGAFILSIQSRNLHASMLHVARH